MIKKKVKTTINSGEILLFNYVDWSTRDPWQNELLRISLICVIWFLKFFGCIFIMLNYVFLLSLRV